MISSETDTLALFGTAFESHKTFQVSVSGTDPPQQVDFKLTDCTGPVVTLLSL